MSGSGDQFDELRVLGERGVVWLEPKGERLTGVGECLGFSVACRGAPGQLGKHCGKAAGLKVLLNYKAEFHGRNLSAQSRPATGLFGGKSEGRFLSGCGHSL
jgi:hypothetical protein